MYGFFVYMKEENFYIVHIKVMMKRLNYLEYYENYKAKVKFTTTESTNKASTTIALFKKKIGK